MYTAVIAIVGKTLQRLLRGSQTKPLADVVGWTDEIAAFTSPPAELVVSDVSDADATTAVKVFVPMDLSGDAGTTVRTLFSGEFVRASLRGGLTSWTPSRCRSR